MKTTSYLFNKIEVIAVEKLNTIHFNGRVIIDKNCSFEKIEINDLVSLEQTDKIENKVKMYTIKCNALLTSSFSSDQPICFLLTNTHGEQYLLGTECRPFPSHSIVDNCPVTPSGKSGSQLSISYINTIPLLQVIL